MSAPWISLAFCLSRSLMCLECYHCHFKSSLEICNKWFCSNHCLITTGQRCDHSNSLSGWISFSSVLKWLNLLTHCKSASAKKTLKYKSDLERLIQALPPFFSDAFRDRWSAGTGDSGRVNESADGSTGSASPLPLFAESDSGPQPAEPRSSPALLAPPPEPALHGC